MRRFPLVVIHAIENPMQRALAIAQQTIQAATHFFGGDLARITRAHRGDGIAKSYSCLQTIHLAVEFDSGGSEIIPRQIRERKMACGKNTLVREVMNREA